MNAVPVAPPSPGPVRSRRPEYGTWRTSTLCTEVNCVEVASDGRDVAVRNSCEPDGPVLTVPARAWAGFLAALRDGGGRPAVGGERLGPFVLHPHPGGVRLALGGGDRSVAFTGHEWDTFLAGVREADEFAVDWLLRPVG